jgi:DNA-binding LytR/AlgR family response regulator
LKNYLQIQKQQLLAQQVQLVAHQENKSTSRSKKYQEFMAKLPLEKRGQLLCLEMDDHYLKVHTDQGHHLLLMRFKDALSFLEDYPGVQAHRSWWVAKDAIVGEEKIGRKLLLKLVNQQLVPVSRSYTEKVKLTIQQLVVAE